MKLYYSPGACSLSPHIAASEAGVDVELVKVDLKTHKLANGEDFYTIHGKGYVPLLELDDGQLLAEGPVIVQYLADRNPASGIAPAAGTMERYRLQEWLNFISTELHKQFSPLFDPTSPAEWKETVKGRVSKRVDWLQDQLAGKDYLLGDFSVADAYLYTVSRWGQFVGVDLSGYANIVAFQKRMEARPGVQAALRAEGFLK